MSQPEIRYRSNDEELATSISKYKLETASIILETGCLSFYDSEKVKLNSTILIPMYIDNRLILSDTNARDKIINYLTEEVNNFNPDVIAGVATAGIPHAAFISENLNLPMIYARTEPKKHGKGKFVEGLVIKGQCAAVIEDTVTTATSSLAAIKALREEGIIIEDLFAIYTYGLQESEENLKKTNVKLHALTDLKTLLSIAQEKGILDKNQITEIRKWSQNPRAWGKS